jgi:hypothetical protein
MADRVLFIGWDAPVRGREERSMEVFNDAVGICGRMQQDGRIERFDVVFLPANATPLGGYIQLHGTADQLAAVREDAEFQRNTIDAALCVDGLCHLNGFTNEGIAQQMAMYQEALEHVPQMT